MATSIVGGSTLLQASYDYVSAAQRNTVARKLVGTDNSQGVRMANATFADVRVQFSTQSPVGFDSESGPKARLSAPATPMGDRGPTIDALTAMLVEVEVQSQARLAFGNKSSPQVAVGVALTDGTPEAATAASGDTRGYIDFTPDPADANGDGIVTSTEQLLYDATHLSTMTAAGAG